MLVAEAAVDTQTSIQSSDRERIVVAFRLYPPPQVFVGDIPDLLKGITRSLKLCKPRILLGVRWQRDLFLAWRARERSPLRSTQPNSLT